MKIKAYAKVNLALHIINKRNDGFHNLDMIMMPISLHDLIYIDIINDGIQIESNNPSLPLDDKNIVYKIADYMIKEFKLNKGLKIYIYKHIPSQAGLAGGSSDGAAVLRAINNLFKLGLTLDELAKIGSIFGSDIPFCIYQKTARVSGTGENISFLDNNINFKLLIVKPRKGVSTKKAFSNFKLESNSQNCDLIVNEIESGNYNNFKKLLHNDLEKVSLDFVSEIDEIKNKLIELNFDAALMSGSGSAVFGISQNSDIIKNGFDYFKNKKYFVRKVDIV